MSETIKVVVRVRPMNQKEKDRGCKNILLPDGANNQISIEKPDEKQNLKSFGFDYVFDDKSIQEHVYEKTAFKLVENVLEGYNGTIFAYGQTGCGKTHSMVGKLNVEEERGIIPRTFNHILGVVKEATNKQFLIRCSFIEIYNQQVRDLLGKDVKAKLDVKETPDKGVFIKDLSQNTAKTYEDMMYYMDIGNKNRSVGETLMNKDSSRSHSIFTIYVQVAEKCNGNDRYIAGKLNLVDLAGSERISKTGAAGDRLKQAQKINLSLSALGNVISALVDSKSQHIPYRDSKLTRLLQDSLGGNTKTVMIANCSPADYNYDQTLSTLRYAARAKFIKNKPVINQDPKDALLKQYSEQIKQLKIMLQNGGGNINVAPSSLSPDIKRKLNEKQQQLSNEKQQRRKLQQRIRQLQSQQVHAGDVKVQQKFLSQIQKVRQQMKDQIPNTKQNPKSDQDLQPSKNLNESEQLQKYKKLCKKYKGKINQLESEIRDINKQNYDQKQILLDQIRQQTKENNLLQMIISMMLSKQEIEIIRNAAVYNDQKQEYRIPPFHLRNKKLLFPKLTENALKDMMKDEVQNRQLVFQNKSNTSLANNQKPNSKNQVSARCLDKQQDQNLILNNVIKNAKLAQPLSDSQKGKQGKKQKKQRVIIGNVLQPIKNTRLPLSPQSQEPNSALKMVRKGQLQPLQ